MVDAALENFLEARHAAEISSIGDAIVVLENRTSKSREALQAARDELEALRAARAAKLGSKTVRRPTAPSTSLPLDSKVSGSRCRSRPAGGRSRTCRTFAAGA